MKIALRKNILNFIVLASIKSDLIEKNPGLASEIEYLSSNDPSKRDKYLIYSAKVLKSGQALKEEISDVINLFDRYKDRLDKKDINAWNFTELRDNLFKIRDEFAGMTKTKFKKVDPEKSWEIRIDGGKLFTKTINASSCSFEIKRRHAFMEPGRNGA